MRGGIACRSYASLYGFIDFLQDSFEIVLITPTRIIVLEFRYAADPPNVIADPVVVYIRPFQLAAADAFAIVYGLKHRAAGMTAATHVVYLSGSGPFKELPERIHKVGAV